MLPTEDAGTFRSRNIAIDDYDTLKRSVSLDAITAVSCSEWLYLILNENERFARDLFSKEVIDIVFLMSQTRARRIEKLTMFFYKNISRVIKNMLDVPLDSEYLRRVLSRAKMSGIPSRSAGDIVKGSEEDLLSRISTIAFALQTRICPKIANFFPVHFSAWSLAHICVATAERDSLSSNLFMVGRQSRGVGTLNLSDPPRIVRDAIFTFVPKRLKDDDGPVKRVRPLSHAAYISSEDNAGYWLFGLPAEANGAVSAEDAPVWWEYTGRSSKDDMKLFFFSQHVEPRAQDDSPAEPRIFNALMLGHIRDEARGHLPGTWVALVKRVKNYAVVIRHSAAPESGLWIGASASRDDTADIMFTSECLCFHGKLDEMTRLYHRSGLVGRIANQHGTEEAISIARNETYGFGTDVTNSSIAFPMQLAARFFVIPGDDPRYKVIDDVFFSRGTAG